MGNFTDTILDRNTHAGFQERRPMTSSEPDTIRAATRGIWLSTGFHESREDGMNILECVAYISGAEHSSYPPSACPVISEVVRTVAERATEAERQTLVQYILPIACSAAADSVIYKRLFYCVDFVVRQLAPATLTYFGRVSDALALQNLPEIKDIDSAETARQALRGLFINAFLDPVATKLSHTLGQLESMAHNAAKVLSTDGDALTVLIQLKATLTRFEMQADANLANMLFVLKRVLLENLLCIGPNRPVQPELIKLRRQRIARLEAKMASGTIGRVPGAESET